MIIFLLGLLTPFLTPHGPNDADLSMVNAPVGTPGYPLGADETGRDICTRLLHSINTAAISALIGASVALAVGVIAGLIGGYFGRGHAIVDRVAVQPHHDVPRPPAAHHPDAGHRRRLPRSRC